MACSASLCNFFQIPPSDDFTDLADTELTLVVQVLKKDLTRIETYEETRGEDGNSIPASVSVPNDFFDNLMKRVGLQINNTNVGSSHYYHPQISVLKTILSYSDIVSGVNLKHGQVWIVSDRFFCSRSVRFFYVCFSRTRAHCTESAIVRVGSVT